MTSALALLALATLRIDWDAPPACPTAADLEARVGALVPPGEERLLVATVDAKVEKEALRWRASLEITVPQGRTRREVVGKTCEELTDAVALLVAATLDPVGARRQLTGSRDGPPKPPAAHPEGPGDRRHHGDRDVRRVAALRWRTARLGRDRHAVRPSGSGGDL